MWRSALGFLWFWHQKGVFDRRGYSSLARVMGLCPELAIRGSYHISTPDHDLLCCCLMLAVRALAARHAITITMAVTVIVTAPPGYRTREHGQGQGGRCIKEWGPVIRETTWMAFLDWRLFCDRSRQGVGEADGIAFFGAVVGSDGQSGSLFVLVHYCCLCTIMCYIEREYNTSGLEHPGRDGLGGSGMGWDESGDRTGLWQAA